MLVNRIYNYLIIVSLCLITNSYGYPSDTELIPLPRDKYLDKCKGAWLGQMIGVTFGDKYEFRYNGIPIFEPLQEWKSEYLKNAFPQDDLYVEMTFLEALENNGLNITFEDAGNFFANSKYPLWHANRAGRDNLKKGINPPFSGHPDYNHHADDSDFQIESDLFGIICPGLPKESQKLGRIFGSIMNYGDGLYGGFFIAGMYASAFFENDIEKVILSGLECIPPESRYRKCIEDTIDAWRKYPDNWFEAWKIIENKWQDDVDCLPGIPVNIDAKINGAYVVMGLLYGNGDMQKTIEIATRCGQDTDCNASSSAGILGCIKGFSNIDDYYKQSLPNLQNEKFLFTNYSWNDLISACEKLTKEIITQAGGKIEKDTFLIPLQKPSPPSTLEQWTNKQDILKPPIPKEKLSQWTPNWRVKSCKFSPEVGVFTEGNDIYLSISQPQDENIILPSIIESYGNIPQNAQKLSIEARTKPNEEMILRVKADYKTISEQKIVSNTWTKIDIDISGFPKDTTMLTIESFSTHDKKSGTIHLKPIKFE